MKRYFAGFLLAMLALPAVARQPKDPWTEWFQRAATQMDLRAYGSTPFHMKVTFHAFPGIVLSSKPSEQIMSGDGIYDEYWVAPTKWRREVTLGGYHAVEVQSEAGRKMQASSDYEPSRILMLLEALLYPIPRDLSSPALGGHDWWKLESGTTSNLSYTKISRTYGTHPVLMAYLFLSTGELVQSIDQSVVTDFTGPRIFGGRLVPQRIRVQGGTNDLLTANVGIESAPGPLDEATFSLPGAPAEAGMTLRPLHQYEVQGWDVMAKFGELVGPEGPFRGVIRQTIDRHGASREVELIYPPQSSENARTILPQARNGRYHPVTIDKSPCEFVVSWSL